MNKLAALFLVAVFLLPHIAFAQDVGEILFRNLLRMPQYPGPPFSGDIMQDIVMFFFIPTVFIILVVYTVAGRIVDNTKLDLLLSIALYLFIIFGGYYSVFALLAGPYFFFLVIIMGLLLFLKSHFVAGTTRPPSMPGRATGMTAGTATDEAMLEMRYKALLDQLGAAKKDMDKHRKEYMDFGKKGGDTSFAVGELAQTRSFINQLLGELREVQLELQRLNPKHRLVAQINADMRKFALKE
ncbi:MAG: hypothetical protein HYY37_03130 [Candidatus Aenigmarchaeota archaeon]|nr:hypothetical protein [Candidatus Aenigmarchaeota archaeon]